MAANYAAQAQQLAAAAAQTGQAQQLAAAAAQTGAAAGAVGINQTLLQQMLLQQQQSQVLAAAAAGAQLPGQAQYAMMQGYGGQFMQQQQPMVRRQPKGDAGIVGLCAVTTKALAPVAHMDPDWTLEEMAFKVCGHIGKAAAKYWKEPDDRLTSRQTVAKGQAIVEEFVEAALHNISSSCSEKPWFNTANLTDPLMHATMGTFENKQTTFMCRTLKPVIRKTIDDAIARYREEERVQKGLWEAVVISGLPEAYQKAANKHLQGAFDRAHMGAPYGSTTAESPALGLVQDFVKGWMQEFAGRAWNVLSEGVSADQEEQYAFLTTLFQHLTDPEQCCLPFELVSQPGAMPPENWAFVADTAMAILKSEDQEGGAGKKRKR